MTTTESHSSDQSIPHSVRKGEPIVPIIPKMPFWGSKCFFYLDQLWSVEMFHLIPSVTLFQFEVCK